MELKLAKPMKIPEGLTGRVGTVALIGSLEFKDGELIAFNIGDCTACEPSQLKRIGVYAYEIHFDGKDIRLNSEFHESK